MTKKEEIISLLENPFLTSYKTPHDTVPFDRITLKDYEPAIMEGIRQENEEIDRIITNTEAPTFANTIARLAEIGRAHV